MDNGACSYRRYLDGDDRGLVELIYEYKDGLILFICGMVGDSTAAEEIAEDTFVKLAVKKPRFSGNCLFRTWLYAIGANAARDRMRHASRMAPLSAEEYEDIGDDEADVAAAYLRDERKTALHRAMRRLNPDYRQVLYLTYFEDMSNTDAGKVMKKSSRQISNLLFRAKAALKTELEKEGITYENI